MTNRIKDIEDLFSMFHDFEIVGLKLEKDILTMEILLPWSEMWDIIDYKMTFRFSGCTSLKCNYFVQTNKEYTTTDISEIVKLELDVQSCEFKAPNGFSLHCNSYANHGDTINSIAFARVELNVSDYQIFDNDNHEMTLDKMKQWGTDWWDGIQKMWDEQKAEK